MRRRGRKRLLWIEQYHGCGCSSGPLSKRKLLGYCADHGNSVMVRYPVWVKPPKEEV